MLEWEGAQEAEVLPSTRQLSLSCQTSHTLQGTLFLLETEECVLTFSTHQTTDPQRAVNPGLEQWNAKAFWTQWACAEEQDWQLLAFWTQWACSEEQDWQVPAFCKMSATKKKKARSGYFCNENSYHKTRTHKFQSAEWRIQRPLGECLDQCGNSRQPVLLGRK